MFRPQKILFSAVNIVVFTAFFISVFFGIYAYSLNQLSIIESNLSSIDKSTKELRNQIEKLNKQFPVIGKNKLLSTEIARLNKELESRPHAIRYLAQLQPL